ncbi:MAG TPA: hypothetical protein VNH15_02770 [Elusimicrobiota bacterium]|nr:hypothetical protein [Elusimicrobiota bacterium]
MIAKRARKPALKKAVRKAAKPKTLKLKTLLFRPAAGPSFEPQFQQPTGPSRGEQAWLSLTRADHDDDRWGQVEEHLLGQAQEKEHSLRRWKYFAR